MIQARPAIVLSFDSKGFRQLDGSLRFQALLAGEVASTQVRVVRYDSSGLDLAAQGIGLAVREFPNGGPKRQIVSFEGTRFGRWETILAGEGPNLSLLSQVCPQADLRGLTLVPLAVETLDAQALTSGAAHISLESGTVEGRTGQAQLYRAVVSGNLRSWRRLLRLSRLMAGLAPCDLHLGEGDFCLTLAQGLEGKPRKARRLALRGIERAGDALRLIARAGIEQIASNLSPVMSVNGESVEGVHQMRVGVRRLRSALSLFRPLLPPESAVRVLADLRELGSLMGPVRDRDVFLETIMAPVRALASDHEGLISLEETLTQERDAIFDAARHALDQSRFASFMLDLLEWSEAGTLALDSDLLEFADAALDKRHAKLIKAGRDFETLDPLQRHALRIRGKKMRYAGDFLQSLFPSGKTRRYLDALAELVEVLGHLNDIAVAKRVLEERLASSNDSSLHHGIGLAEGWHAGRAALLEEQAVKAWAEFKRQDRFWK